jgi:hypothetical protein
MTMTIKIKGTVAAGPDSLCRTCRWAHMQRGFREGEEAIFCNFGALRPVGFDVAECTDFEHRPLLLPQQWDMEKLLC